MPRNSARASNASAPRRKGGSRSFRGGSYVRIRPQYYRDTSFRDFRSPDHGDFDVLEAVLPSARKRGMKVICWFEDVFRPEYLIPIPPRTLALL